MHLDLLDPLESCIRLGLNANHSSCPLMVNIISPAPTLMVAFAVFRNGRPRIRGIFLSSYMSSTTKSTGTKKSQIFTVYFLLSLQDSRLIGQLVASTLLLE